MADAEPSKRLARDQCVAKAKESRDMARSSANAEYRTMLEQMAASWDRMAASFKDRND
jgi:hypothetical protein